MVTSVVVSSAQSVFQCAQRLQSAQLLPSS
jgi:hypothetical protein